MCRPTYPFVLGISLLVWWYLSLITAVSWSTINEIAVASTTKALDSWITHNQGNVCPGRQFITCTCLASFGLTWILKLCCHNFWKLQCVWQVYWFVGKHSSQYLWTELFVQFCSPPAQTISFKAHYKTMHTAGTSGFIYSSPVSIILL